MPRGKRKPIVPIGMPQPVDDPDQLAGKVVKAIVDGGGMLQPHATLGLPTDADRKRVARVVGETVEAFNAKVSQKLGIIADQVLDVIKTKLTADEFKTSELAFLFSVMHDKKQVLEGRSAVQNAAINVQINQYGSSVSKQDLILMLEGKMKPRAEPGPVVEVEPEEPEQATG